MIGVWLFPTVLWVCLQFVIVVFPDHTHLLFFEKLTKQSLEYYYKVAAEKIFAFAQIE